MVQINRTFRQHLIWLASLSLVILTSVLTIAPGLLYAAEVPNQDAQYSGQVFTAGLTVHDGDVYDGDVTVVSGDVTVESGGLVNGSLNVLSGNVEVQDGGNIDGSLSVLSGNVSIAGQVAGDVAAMSGNIELKNSAQVDGDVSVVSGNLDRAPEAKVGGNVVRGRGFSLPNPFPPERPAAPGVVNNQPSFWGWLAALMLRMVLAVILIGLVVVLASVFFNLRPNFLMPIEETMVTRTAYSFIVGLVVNLVLLIITSGLFFTVILCLGGLITGAALVALNLVGWTVVSHYVGNRLAGLIRTPMQPVASTALGALLLTGVVALFWAFGGCLRPAGYLIWLLASSFGVGATLVRWLRIDSRLHLPGSATPPAEPAPTPTPNPITPPATTTVAPPQPAVDIVSAPDLAADAPALTEVTSSPPAVADFTAIRGIGPTFNERLHAAGVLTFAQLAHLTPEALAEIIGWTVQRVLNDDLLGQARTIAQERGEL